MPHRPVLADLADDVPMLTLNRPDRRDVIGHEAGLALAAALDRAPGVPGARAAALRAVVRHFAAFLENRAPDRAAVEWRS